MKYRRLGRTGLKVSEIGFGGNVFGRWINAATANALVSHSIELGINYIDTADYYGRRPADDLSNYKDQHAGKGRSEEFLGNAVKGKRQQVIIATKFASPMGSGVNEQGGSRYYIMRAVEASLKRLQTDYIDLYQMHHPDHTTPIEETLRALDDLVKSGKIRYAGCSNYSAYQLCEAMLTSRICNINPFITIQSEYNLIKRDIEAEIVPCCEKYDVGVIPWGPLAGGFLTGEYRKGQAPPAGTRLSFPSPGYGGIFSEANWSKLAKFEAFATARGHKVDELPIAWLLSKPWLSVVISGATNAEQVEAHVKAAAWKLTPEEVAEVDAIT